MDKLYFDSKDVQRLLGFGNIRTAQIRIKAMNDELKSRGYWIERGKIPVSFFYEKYPYLLNKKAN